MFWGATEKFPAQQLRLCLDLSWRWIMMVLLVNLWLGESNVSCFVKSYRLILELSMGFWFHTDYERLPAPIGYDQPEMPWVLYSLSFLQKILSDLGQDDTMRSAKKTSPQQLNWPNRHCSGWGCKHHASQESLRRFPDQRCQLQERVVERFHQIVQHGPGALPSKSWPASYHWGTTVATETGMFSTLQWSSPTTSSCNWHSPPGSAAELK